MCHFIQTISHKIFQLSDTALKIEVVEQLDQICSGLSLSV